VEHVEDVWVEVLGEQKRLQGSAVLLNLFMVDHEDLVEPADCPLEPRRLEVDGVGVAPNQVLRENHDEPLKDDEEEVLLVGLRRL